MMLFLHGFQMLPFYIWLIALYYVVNSTRASAENVPLKMLPSLASLNDTLLM